MAKVDDTSTPGPGADRPVITEESEAEDYGNRLAERLFMEIDPAVQNVAIAQFRLACFDQISADMKRNSYQRECLNQAEAALTTDVGNIKP